VIEEQRTNSAAMRASSPKEEEGELDAQVAPVVPAVQLALNREVGLELALVVVVPERDPVAVPVKAKSVIAPHHRGLVRVLQKEEDLAAVAAATTPALAAAEAVRAWVAAE
jgi:hypothetical protein